MHMACCLCVLPYVLLTCNVVVVSSLHSQRHKARVPRTALKGKTHTKRNKQHTCE